jgi:hypothetical protein
LGSQLEKVKKIIERKIASDLLMHIPNEKRVIIHKKKMKKNAEEVK